MSHDAFISYSQKDKNPADAVVSFLEHDGIRCWVAPRDVQPGANWAESIVQAIDSCRVLVVIFSRNANASKHVCREIELAIRRGVSIIPVRIEDVTPKGDLEYFLSSSHWMDAISHPIERHLQKLSTNLRALLDLPPAGVIAPQQDAHYQPELSPSYPLSDSHLLRSRRTPRRLQVAVGAVAIALLGGTTAFFFADFPSPSTFSVDASDPLKDEIAEFESQNNRGDTLPFFASTCPVRFRIWLKEAERDNAVAQHFVGRCLDTGAGVSENHAEARKWFEKAADQGYPAAMNAIGYYYDFGMGYPKDPELAVRWYREAAERGNSVAMNNLGHRYRSGAGKLAVDGQEAVRWFERAAERGNYHAMRNLAGMYAQGGVPGVEKDESTAKSWYQRAADAGDDIAKGVLFVEPLANALDAYSGSKSKLADSASSPERVTSILGRIDELGLNGVLETLSNSRIILSIEAAKKLDATDPVRRRLEKTVVRVIELYRRSGRSIRKASLDGFAAVTSDTVINWYDAGDYQRVAAFWQDCYADLNIAEGIEGEKDGLVNQARAIVISLLGTGRRQEAIRQLDDALSLSDSVLAERPWDWYLKQRTVGLCWDVAGALAELGDLTKSQALLTKAWNITLRMYGRDDLLSRYPILPLKGKAPDNATASDKNFFLCFGSVLTQKCSPMKKFTIPTDFAGTEHPFDVYVLPGKRSYIELQDQFRWVREYRGGIIPTEVENSFRRLNKISTDNNVDFQELVVYAMSSAAKDAKVEKSGS